MILTLALHFSRATRIIDRLIFGAKARPLDLHKSRICGERR